VTVSPYDPEQLPLDCIDWEAHIARIASTNRALARYDGTLLAIPNPDILLSPLQTQEAVLSSRIEGTQASLTDVLRFEANQREQMPEAARADIQEIINYREAMKAAIERLKTQPLDIPLICDLHRILLASVRGRDREPGCIRTIQNFIGSNPYIEHAIFIPPAPEDVPRALENWEQYLQSEEKDILVQLAVLKAQFELIHPFCDGNGRIGRMIVPLILFGKGLLSSPMFYISAYLERHRQTYYDHLLGISRDGDWNGWITFFLGAVEAQADDNGLKAKAILELHDEMEQTVPEITRSQYAVSAIDAIFQTPIFTSSEFHEHSAIPRKSADRILRQLSDAGIIEILAEKEGRRPAMYAFPRLIAITEEGLL
jgi:Fic family protein